MDLIFIRLYQTSNATNYIVVEEGIAVTVDCQDFSLNLYSDWLCHVRSGGGTVRVFGSATLKQTLIDLTSLSANARHTSLRAMFAQQKPGLSINTNAANQS